jgi:hypothetical protein
MEGMCMGWSWALFLANEGITDLAVSGDCGQTMRGREPVPLIAPGRPVSGVYVDNLNTIGWNAADASHAGQSFVDTAEARGFSMHPPTLGADVLDSLGLQFLFAKRLLVHKGRRVLEVSVCDSGTPQPSLQLQGGAPNLAWARDVHCFVVPSHAVLLAAHLQVRWGRCGWSRHLDLAESPL